MDNELSTSYAPFEYHGHEAPELVLVVFGSAEAQLAKQVVNTLAANGNKVGAVNYSGSTVHTPSSIASIIHRLTAKNGQLEARLALRVLQQARQYTFWDVDNSAAVTALSALGKLLAREAPKNAYVHETYDNLVQGGAVRTDIRSSEKPIEVPFAVEEADVVFVGEEKLLKDVDVVKGSKPGSTLILRLPNFKEEDVEKRIPSQARRQIQEKNLELFVARPDITSEQLTKFAEVALDQVIMAEFTDALGQALKKVEVPATWAEAVALAAPFQSFKPTSFVPFQKVEPEPALMVDSWQEAVKGLVFKEAYGTQIELRPDLTVKTFTVHFKENRRLTPLTYDRNIFHFEFDLGDSGLTYNIGEALGIHADNDPKQVLEFIEFYGLSADELVQIPSREDATVFETRTVYRALVQNVDILGKEIGAILLYLGSRHQREEYLYGEEWEAYMDAGVITLLGAAFSRDQPQKIYIQGRMRQTVADIVKAYINEEGSFYLCGPTWPVPDVTAVLEEAIAVEAGTSGRKVDPKKEIERLKENSRYVLEVC
ncbi:hypothetical protein N658DRAFT_489515 [Parathielavia hyrcaniae]|uniref:Uncharacterized protein n=1 Tax=Parathielavia hyrcaniae TaxID=113614 RepID=A0AAN6PWZ5_9PEZI|nr:hypothetical protein N658DRAFT_489515 [Parathielavia hyrcaniae]